MTQWKRNAPCPCQSGRKYKRCCLHVHERVRREMSATRALLPPGAHDDIDWEELDDCSNLVPDLVVEGRYDQAEAIARRLVQDYPSAPDGLERLAEVHEARGNVGQALTCYREAAAIHILEDIEQRVPDWLAEKMQELEKLRAA